MSILVTNSEKLKKLKEVKGGINATLLLERLEAEFRAKAEEILSGMEDDMFRDLEPAKRIAEKVADRKLSEHKEVLTEQMKSVTAKMAEKEAEMRERMDDAFNEMRKEFSTIAASITEAMKSDHGDMRTKMEEIINASFKNVETKLASMCGPEGKPGKDGKGADGAHGRDGKPGAPGKDGSPDTGEQVVVKVNALPLVPDMQIDASHIKNLDRYIKKDKKGQVVHRGGTSVLYYDLSSLCDGVTKSFTIPTNSGVVWVGGTDAPAGQYRKTTDFSVSGNTLTLDAAMLAPSTGATLHLLYIG